MGTVSAWDVVIGLPNSLVFETLANELRNLEADARQSWYEAHAASLAERGAIEEYLSDPYCSGPGEADLARLESRERSIGQLALCRPQLGFNLRLGSFKPPFSARRMKSSTGVKSGTCWVEELLRSQARRRPNCPVCDALSQEWLMVWDPQPEGGA
jgi:hypothetical protein